MTLDPINILDIPYHSTSSEIRRRYKKLSLKVHPDKVPESKKELAKEAFFKLGKAYKDLLDDEKRKDLNEIVNFAKKFLEKKYSSAKKKSITDFTGEKDKDLKREVAKILIDRAWKNRMIKKMSEKYDERAAKEREEWKNDQKEKSDHQRKWVEDRSKRVNSWKKFKANVKKTSRRKVVKGVGHRVKSKKQENGKDENKIKFKKFNRRV
ncbi:hypothetical protein MHBO_002660 [Bonamia ostreae]